MSVEIVSMSKVKIDAAYPPAAEELFSWVADQLGAGRKKRKRGSTGSAPFQARKKQKIQEQKWKESYTKPESEHPQAYAGERSFVLDNRERSKEEERNKRAWLRRQETYQIHKPARRHYARRKFVVHSVREQWQVDLSDMTWLKKQNGGYGWMLIAIEVVSRKVWVTALKQKSGPETARGLKELFDHVESKEPHHPLPNILYVDRGSEFYNKDVKRLLNSYPIPPRLQSGYSNTKAAIVERVQRTLKTRLWTYFYETGSYEWRKKIQDLVEAYNNRKHHAHGFTPNSVTPHNEQGVLKRLYGDWHTQRKNNKKTTKYKFDVGDVVRISKQATIFRKGYLPQWTEEWFKIRARDPGPPPYYRLKDYAEEKVEGTFYGEELQLIPKKQIKTARFRIEKILKRRQDPSNKSKKQVLVKYKGWPEKYNQWISESQVGDLNES